MAIVPALKKPIPVTTATPMSATPAGVSPINTVPANGKFGMTSIPTAEQRANPALQEWVTAKDKENATAQPVTPEQTQYSNNMDAWKQINWGPNGTANGKTGDQNLAAVINQQGNTVKNNPSPYISGVLAQAAKDDAATNTNTDPIMPKQTAPTFNPVASQQSYQPPDYAALAAARTALALAQKKSIADAQKGSLDRSFERDSQITNDNRTLENGQINRTLNPFSGKTAYDKGIIGRERSLVDENKSNNLSAQKANIDQLLSDYQNATADEQVRIADELQKADRQYQLDLANVTGNLTDLNTGQTQRTLQGQQFDYNTNPNNPNNQGQILQNQGQMLNNQLTQFKLNDYPAESQAAAKQVQQQLTAGSLSNEAAAYNLQQLKDPNSTINQANKIDLQLKQIDLKNAPEESRLKLQQLQKQIADIGVVHRAPQTASEAEYDRQQVIKIKAEIAKLNNSTPSTPTVDSKKSTDTHSLLTQDLADARDAAEANALIEANRANLTDADYKDLKKQVTDKF